MDKIGIIVRVENISERALHTPDYCRSMSSTMNVMPKIWGSVGRSECGSGVPDVYERCGVPGMSA